MDSEGVTLKKKCTDFFTITAPCNVFFMLFLFLFLHLILSVQVLGVHLTMDDRNVDANVLSWNCRVMKVNQIISN